MLPHTAGRGSPQPQPSPHTARPAPAPPPPPPAVAENLVEKEDLVSLQNGCVCCSLRKDIVRAFAEIERRNRQRHQLPNGRKVDHVVLETTGLADPAPVAFTFFANPWIASRFRLDSIM